jgi:hypothetical protein
LDARPHPSKPFAYPAQQSSGWCWSARSCRRLTDCRSLEEM